MRQIERVIFWVVISIIFFGGLYWLIPGQTFVNREKGKVCFTYKPMFSFLMKSECLTK